MFLKPVKWQHLNSITTRLTFFYGIATFILLFVIGLFLYGITTHVIHRANYHFLTHEIDILKNLLENKPNNRSALEQKVVEVPYTETGSVYHYFVRILNEKGEMILQTPGTKKVIKKADFLNQPLLIANKQLQRWQVKRHKQYVFMQSQANYNKSGQMWFVQVILDVTYQQQILNQYRFVLLMVLSTGLLFAIFVGYMIAHRGLRSLTELTNTTKKITANSLYRRIDPEFWPKELKMLGMAFNQMLDRIETSFAYLTQFSADLAHELRTPVNNLMGETELALSRECTVEEYQQVFVSNLEELQRISQIIENLLFLARADNPQLDIQKEQLDVASEVRIICEFYQPLADEKNILIGCTGGGSVNANPVMFRRMISNILSNALKYTMPGGRVDFFIEKTEDKTIRITLKDTGIGVAFEHLPKIFNRFYRVDAARSNHSGGVGLGLAIVKSIVELHRGTLSIMSELGKGTSIQLVLP